MNSYFTVCRRIIGFGIICILLLSSCRQEQSVDFCAIEVKNDNSEPYYSFWIYRTHDMSEEEALLKYFFELRFAGYDRMVVSYSIMGDYLVNMCKDDSFYIKKLRPGEVFKYFIKGNDLGQYHIVNLKESIVDSVICKLSGAILFKHDYTIVDNSDKLSVYADSTIYYGSKLKILQRYKISTDITLF